jgi:hypothetical protein
MYFIAEELREIMAGFRTLKKWLDNHKTECKQSHQALQSKWIRFVFHFIQA